MKTYLLQRVMMNKQGTYGVLFDGDNPLCCTVERPWKNNEPFVSCIPEGEYQCESYTSPKFSNVWKLFGVLNRSDILIHVANVPSDVEGCIGVGFGFTVLKGQTGVASSGSMIDRLRGIFPKEGFLLKITNPAKE